ncbi:MAG: UbiD family decarboxylase [Dehalococcoidia bacterium]|nr:UbiD family decarboxylase [Dehalococcoidia bacterium]
MAYADLREFIARLDAEGEIRAIEEEVDWNLELGAIVRRSCDLKAPAPFFQRIKGYPAGYRVIGASAAASSRFGGYYTRVALALGMVPQSSPLEIMEEYIRRKRQLIKPAIVSEGPCKEEVHTGSDVNVLEFPAPFIHAGDGGRYIGTWHAVITKDPDSDWVNWGCYRLMVRNENTLTGLVIPSQHNGILYQKYRTRNQPMEFAIALGIEPVSALVAVSRVPAGVSEVDVVGALRQEPVQLVKAETVDLMVPATAEIVLEGEMLPDDRELEGPFGEYTGYRSHHCSLPQPVYHIKAITHRRDPILPVCVTGVPPTDSIAPALTLAAELLDDLRQRGLPVKSVYIPPASANAMAVVSATVPYAGFAQRVAHSIWATHACSHLWNVVVVDEDVDPTNMDEVVHALSTRCHPDHGIYKVPNSHVHPLAPYLDPQDRPLGKGAYVLFDCTWPKDWRPEEIPVMSSFNVAWPQEIRNKVIEKWTDYGYSKA